MNRKTRAIGLELEDSQALQFARQYRVALDWSHEEGFVARCVEMPQIVTRELGAEATVEAAYERIALHLQTAINRGRSVPSPCSEAEGELGAWMNDVEVLSPPMPAHGPELDESQTMEVHRIARCTAARYRIILSATPDGYMAWSPEVPQELAKGSDVSAAVESLRPALAQHALRMLAYGLMPAEPLQDAEKRSEVHHSHAFSRAA